VHLGTRLPRWGRADDEAQCDEPCQPERSVHAEAQ
jgi:hypothetical protein